MKLTAKELNRMQSVNIGAVSADTLADVSGMAFDNSLSREERLTRFLGMTVNPYCFAMECHDEAHSKEFQAYLRKKEGG